MLPFFYLLLAIVSTGGAEELLIEESGFNSLRVAELAQDPTWKALLHYRGGRCFIKDPKFFLSNQECDLEAELEVLLKTLRSGEEDRIQDVACRFPARVEFVSSQLKSAGLTLVSSSICSELKDYNQQAPSDDISLFFAAENVSHPMSMMGHVFMAFHGKNPSGSSVSHAISFYTSFVSANPFRIISDALIDGMPSYFSLVPLREQLHTYNKKEGRNVWEYVLQLSERQKQLIRLHIWELKYSQTPYYFIGYNCATVVHFILSIAAPQLLNNSGLWIAPIDVVRDAQQYGLIKSRSFHPSLDWRLKAFRAALYPSDASLTEKAVNTASPERFNSLPWGMHDHIRVEYAKALIDREVESREKYQPIEDTIEKINGGLPLANISVENLKDPLKAAGFPQIGLGVANIEGKSFGKLSLLPLSHALLDDHSNSASESSLQIGGLTLLNNLDSNQLIFDQLNLYSFDSLVPEEPSHKRLSTRFRASFDRQLNKEMDWLLSGTINGGLGKTFEATDDFRYYFLANLGFNHGGGDAFLSVWPEIGLSLYEILDMKSSVSYKFMCIYGGDTGCLNSLSATQSIFITRSAMTFLKLESAWSSVDSWDRYELGFRISF